MRYLIIDTFDILGILAKIGAFGYLPHLWWQYNQQKKKDALRKEEERLEKLKIKESYIQNEGRIFFFGIVVNIVGAK